MVENASRYSWYNSSVIFVYLLVTVYLAGISKQRRQLFLAQMNVTSLQYCKNRLERRLEEVNIALSEKKQNSTRENTFNPIISDGNYDKLLFG